MKKILLQLLFALLISWQINAQVTTIANPDSGQGYQPFRDKNGVTYNGKFYFSYSSLTSTQLAEFDGTSISLIANPGNQTGFIQNMINFNNQVYYFTQSNNKYRLATYNGSNVSLINNPEIGDIRAEVNPIIFQNNLYFVFITESLEQKLAKFDGSTITLMNAPVVNTNIYEFFEFNNKLYYTSNTITSKTVLSQFDGTNTSILTNPDATGNVRGGNFAIQNSKLYFGYSNASGNKFNLVEFNGTSSTLLPNPDNGEGFSLSVKPVVCNNKLYYAYRDAASKGRLVELNNSTYNLLANPDSGFGIRNLVPIVVANNNVFYLYENTSEKNQLAKYDGTSITLINNPDVGRGVNFALVNLNNKLYSNYSNATNKNQLYQYDGTSSILIANELSTDIGLSGTYLDVFSNKLIFNYTISQSFFSTVTKFGVYSPPCTLPTITYQPINTTITTNTNTNLVVNASGATSYQWQFDANLGFGFQNLSDGGVYSNTNSASLQITGASSSMNGFLYRCVVTNGVSSCLIISDIATLTVLPNAPTANNQTFCSSTSPTIGNIEATGIDLRWYDLPNGVLEIPPGNALLLGTATYYVSQTVNGAESPKTAVQTTVIQDANNITTLVACGSYTWANNGQTYTTSGNYTGTTTNCVTQKLKLTINQPTSNSDNVTACSSFTWAANGTTYTTSGIYTSVGTNAVGCDDTRTLNLTINVATTSESTVSACGTYTWLENSQTYTTSGTYTSVGTNANGCVDTKTLNLTINQEPTPQVVTYQNLELSVPVQAGATYLWSRFNLANFQFEPIGNNNIQSISQTGAYRVVISLNGCEYVTGKNINQLQSPPEILTTTNGEGCQNVIITVTATATPNAVITWYSQANTDNPIATASSVSYDELPVGIKTIYVQATLNGLSSDFVPVTITVIASTNNTVSATACASYTWANNNQTYTTSGIYTGTTTNCVIEKLDLTINEPTSSSTSISSCSSLYWIINGQTYTTSGTYTFVGTNANGCVDTQTLNLTINQPTSSSVNATACGTYTWSANGTTYTTSGTYTYVGVNSNECDDIKTLNLTINPNPTATQLAITKVGATLTVAQTGAIYQWFEIVNGTGVLISGATNQSYTATTSGFYYVEVTINGCTTEADFVSITINLANDDFDFNSKLSIYPNPSTAIFNINIDSNATIEVLDLLGKRILTKNINLGTSELDMSNFASSVYMLKITNADKQTKTVRIMKQ